MLSEKFGDIGFRKIKEFNLAMLGKQALRVMTEPHSFIDKLTKSLYFPSCSVGKPPLGGKPSYVW